MLPLQKQILKIKIGVRGLPINKIKFVWFKVNVKEPFTSTVYRSSLDTNTGDKQTDGLSFTLWARNPKLRNISFTYWADCQVMF